MPLPNDIARCAGEANGQTCTHRDTCLRYLERPKGDTLAWWMHPQIPGPCVYLLPAPAEGLIERHLSGPRTGEASEPEQSAPDTP